MSTLPPEPVIAVDSTTKPKEIREEGYVPQSINGKAPLGAGSEAKPVEPSKPRFKLTRFRDITFTKDVPYLVKDLLPIQGLVVVWGPPKCGKSFVIFDLSMHIALGWGYRGKHVQQAPVVYLALEGGKGFTHRVEAFRRHHKVTNAPFYLITDRAALVYDHKQLITEIKGQLREPRPALVVIDTLNRSLTGSENSDKDMGDYIRAADVIREAFECTVVIIHHCGVSGDRPRGHTVRHQRSLDRTGGLLTFKVSPAVVEGRVAEAGFICGSGKPRPVLAAPDLAAAAASQSAMNIFWFIPLARIAAWLARQSARQFLSASS